jgi:hypothetical protein
LFATGFYDRVHMNLLNRFRQTNFHRTADYTLTGPTKEV